MACSALAHAQYVWLDEKGGKQFSDRPPPSSVPAKRILKAPGAGAQNGMPATADAADDNAAPATKPKTAPTLAERDADFRKRLTEQAANDKKADDEAQRKADRASNCQGAGQNQRLLASGRRIGVMDKDGERSYMSDEERALETKKIKRILDDCK